MKILIGLILWALIAAFVGVLVSISVRVYRWLV